MTLAILAAAWIALAVPVAVFLARAIELAERDSERP